MKLTPVSRCLSLFTVAILFASSISIAQPWLRCSIGLPQDTPVYSLAKIGTTLFAGTQHAGIYKSIDKGNNWETTELHNPFRQSTIRALAVIDTFLFAAQSGNGIARISLHGTNWIPVNNGIPKGSGNRIIFDLIAAGDTLYAASYNAGVYVSYNLGEQWELLYNNAGLNDLHTLSLAANSQYLFVGTAGSNYTMPDTGVAFVTDRFNGSSWSLINNGLARNGAHLEQTFSFAANDEVIYCGTDDVGIHRSIDNGQNWFRIPPTNEYGDIWDIEIVGHQVYYGTLYHGIFTSGDDGLSFHENNAGLNHNGISIPDIVPDFVVLDDYIYAATSTGVYKQLLSTTAIEKENTVEANSFIIYPNPGNGHFQISSPVEQAELYDMTGRKLGHFQDVDSIDVQYLQSGMYVICLLDAGHVSSLKVVIE